MIFMMLSDACTTVVPSGAACTCCPSSASPSSRPDLQTAAACHVWATAAAAAVEAAVCVAPFRRPLASLQTTAKRDRHAYARLRQQGLVQGAPARSSVLHRVLLLCETGNRAGSNQRRPWAL